MTNDISDCQAAVSVIVPTFNRPAYLKQCLDALLEQLNEVDQLIVVNDGSTDNTKEMLTAYANRIELVEQENGGKSAALNNGMKHVVNPFVWIVDDDDIVATDARDRLLRALIDSPASGFAYGRHDRFCETSHGQSRTFFSTGYWVECSPEEFLIHNLEDMFPHQPGMMVRKSLYDKVGEFRSRYDRSEDYDMLLRLAIESKPIAVPGILFHQRVHSGVRGSAANPVLEGQRNQNWINIGKMLALELIDGLDLEFFLPERQMSGAIDRRRAHIERGVIFGRHHDWDRAIDEFETAASVASSPLEARDKEILRRIAGSKFGLGDFTQNRSLMERLGALAGTSRSGSDICQTIGLSLRWRVREAFVTGRFALATRLASRSLRLSRAHRRTIA